jgi:hypothetical protein
MVTIDWSAAVTKLVEGAERLWHFEVVRGWRRHAASSLQWSFIEYSPVTLSTGIWGCSTIAADKIRELI